MCSFKSIYFVIFILNLYKTNAQISDKRLCVDPDCKEPASLAKTLLRYSSPDARILSFAPNSDVTIYSKEAGSETNLWGAEIKGKRGYVPKHLVREYKVLNVPKLLVDTELKQKPQVPIDVTKENVKPNKVQESFEVVDGTTIYSNPEEGINPSSTESPILSTTVHEGSKGEKDDTVDLKEKDAIKGESKEESVVDNVLSTFSNWMGDDTNSEELEGNEDDDEDEEDEEEEDEDESAEEGINSQEKIQDQVNKTDPETLDVLNSLHNLPHGVKVSPYKLEVVESTEDNLKRESVSSTDGSSSVPSPQESNEQKQEKTLKNPALSSVSKPPSNSGSVLPDNTLEIKKEVVENLPSDSAGNLETVTEASYGEEEQSPILDDVTPNPLGKEMEKQPKTTDPIKETPLPPSDTSQQNVTVDSSENLLVDSAKPQSKTVEPAKPNTVEELNNNPQTPVSVEENKLSQSDYNQNLVQEDNTIKILPPLGVGVLFNKTQTVVPNEQAENEGTPTAQSLIEDSKIENVVLKEEISEEKIGIDVSKEEITIQENDIVSEVSASEQEFISNLSNEDSANKGESSKEEADTDTKEEIVNDITKDVLTEEYVFREDADLTDASKDKLENPASHAETNQQTIEETPPSIPELNNPESKEGEISNDDIVNDTPALNEDPVNSNEEQSNILKDSGGFFSGLFSLFGSDNTDDSVPNTDAQFSSGESISNGIQDTFDENLPYMQESVRSDSDHCYGETEDCNTSQQEVFKEKGLLENFDLRFNTDIFLYLITTAISVILFLFGYMALDRNRREAPLVAKINKLEKQLLITLKENELLQENGSSILAQATDSAPKEIVDQLTQTLTKIQLTNETLEVRIAELERELEEKEGLEEQIENLEKELETSTEVGMELNRIISEMLDPTNGSDRLKENVEQLQRQLLEQKDTINKINESLRDKVAENKTLRVELERSKKRSSELHSKLDEVAEKIMKIENEKDQQQSTLQNEIAIYQQKYSEAISRDDILNNDIQVLRTQLSEVQRQAEIKTREYQTLKENMDKIKSIRNDSNALKSLLDATSIKAELQQLKAENDKYIQQLQQEQTLKVAFEKKYQVVVEEINAIKDKYDKADKEKVEVNSKLEVLNNYFKKRESELQEEVIKYKSIWDTKHGEATSTSERIKYMQEEVENYKAQNDALKQEIMSQEIELKSQISMLEKKVHENWVAARQADRKLEDARQEAAQLRNRLTLRERAIHEERAHNRLQSPIEQNGELPLSPHPMDSPASPPLLYGRDHITKSPPLPGMPPFLPPPPGAPFMPPPIHGMPPFMPPPPSMYPADHRPPPLGRMSSPPLNSRYSPDNSAFSPYDRRSPSPPYDSEYGASPPPLRGYSPYNSRDDRRDYKRPPHTRTNGRNTKGSRISSESDHSNDSLDKINRKQSKMV